MSLQFVGPGGSFETRWLSYAILRDNVQHHLEGGLPSARFQALHQIATALGRRGVRVNARSLHQELLEIERLLPSRPFEELAVSPLTCAVLFLRWPPPAENHTYLARESLPGLELLLGSPSTLGEIFGHLSGSLLRITHEAREPDLVEVSDL